MAQEQDFPSQDALAQANKTQNEFSGYQGALGQAGYKDPSLPVGADQGPASFLGRSGESVAITPAAGGFGDIYVGCAWEMLKSAPRGFFARLLGLVANEKIDLDLGALCELQDGSRMALQALGDSRGAHDRPPYISLSPDERTGMAAGDDEFFKINGAMWPAIKRVLIYVYIYQGCRTWADIRPRVRVDIPGQPDVTITPHGGVPTLPLCALVLLENSRNGMKITNLTEYFPGQAEMDRAYGFGFMWDEGAK